MNTLGSIVSYYFILQHSLYTDKTTEVVIYGMEPLLIAYYAEWRMRDRRERKNNTI
jgi:hypothetical protein